jgi:hypothetical protein
MAQIEKRGAQCRRQDVPGDVYRDVLCNPKVQGLLAGPEGMSDRVLDGLTRSIIPFSRASEYAPVGA